MLSAQNIAVSTLPTRNSPLFQDFQIDQHSNIAMSTPNIRSSPLFQNFQTEIQSSEETDFPIHDDFVDLLHGNSNLSSNGHSSDQFGMLVTPSNSDNMSTPDSVNPPLFQDFQPDSQHANITMSTPNARSSPLFQNFQTDNQTSPIGSPYSPVRPSYRPVTKNRALGFSDSEDIPSNGFDIFGFGAQGHIGSERTLSSSSNASFVSETSFSQILRSIHKHGDGSAPPMPSAPVDVVNHGPLSRFFENRLADESNPYAMRNKNGFPLGAQNGASSLMNSRFNESEENFLGNSADLNCSMIGESSPPTQQAVLSSILDRLSLSGDSPSYGGKPQMEKDDDMWMGPSHAIPAVTNYLRAIKNLPSVLPSSEKELIKLLSMLTDLQDGIHIISDPMYKEQVNQALHNVKQRIVNQLYNPSPSPPSFMKDSPSRFNDQSFERNPRYHLDNIESFENHLNQTIWNGKLPLRNHKNATYSCKVFLGGLPWDITESNLFHAFKLFNPVKVEWPIKDGHLTQSKGYAYMVFESEKMLRLLLQSCSFSYVDGGCWYHKVSSKKMKSKDAQIIPWSQWDTNFNMSPTPKLDSQKTVFVGALHGMINAHGLALIMEELFGGVIYAGIDTDRHRYPIGSGRVAFNNTKSYTKAISARFIDVKVTQKFTKTIQVDPYLEDATCSVCNLQQGPYFCRDFSCFCYFCKTCYQVQHSYQNMRSHQFIMRNSAKPQSTPGSFMPSNLSQRNTSNGIQSSRMQQQSVQWQPPFYQGVGNNGRNGHYHYHNNSYNNPGYQNQMQNPAGFLNNSSSSPYVR